MVALLCGWLKVEYAQEDFEFIFVKSVSNNLCMKTDELEVFSKKENFVSVKKIFSFFFGKEKKRENFYHFFVLSDPGLHEWITVHVKGTVKNFLFPNDRHVEEELSIGKGKIGMENYVKCAC